MSILSSEVDHYIVRNCFAESAGALLASAIRLLDRGFSASILEASESQPP